MVRSLMVNQGTYFIAALSLTFDCSSLQNPCLLTCSLTCATQGRPSLTRRPLKHDSNIHKCCSSAQLSCVFISNMQTQRDKLLLDSLGHNLKKALVCSRTLSSEKGQEELHGKEGQYPDHWLKPCRKRQTWERDYTHDFYPGPNFFPHADSWSLSDGKCCTMQP